MPELPIYVIAAIRFTVSGIILLVITYFYEGNLSLSYKIWIKVFLLGAIGMFNYQLFFVKVLSIITTMNTALMLALSLIFTTIHAFFNKKQVVR